MVAPCELLDAVGVKAYADLPAVELPYGRKRALEIATTLALDPEMLLLDEPMAGMGAEDIQRTSALIRRVAKDRTVLMVEHNLSVVADLSDRDHGAGARRGAGRRPLCRGLQEPAGDRSLHGDRAMAEAQLAVRDRARLVRREPRPARHDVRRQRRRGRHAAGPQRRRQDHDHARHHGACWSSRKGSITLRGTRAHPPQVEPHRAAGHRLLPGGARHLRQPERAREPDAAAEVQARRA